MSFINTLKAITSHPLNRDRRIAALARFGKWQIGSRLVPGAIVYDWVNGSKLVVRTGETGLTGNIYTGLHEFSDMGFLLHVLREDDLFVDVGANAGSYSVLACAAIGASGVAFEPVPDTYRRLLANLRLNELSKKVVAMNMGVGAAAGHMFFTRNLDTTNHVVSVDEHSAETISVEVITLDVALKGRSPSMLKIDVEGYEAPVMQGAETILRTDSLHSVIMELNGSGERYGFDESKLLELMFDYDFRTYSYDPLTRRLVSLEEGKNKASGNTLFIRNELLIKDRLKAAPTVKICGREF